MIRRLLALLLLLGCAPDPAPSELAAAELRLQRAKAPAFLHSAFRQLDTVLTSGQRDTLSRLAPDSAAIYHLSLGLYIRNQMGLWRSAPIAESLSVRGVRHPDDMSGVILVTYVQYLRGDSVDVERAIAVQPKPPVGFKVLSAPIKGPVMRRSNVALKPTAPALEAAGSLRSPAALLMKRRGLTPAR